MSKSDKLCENCDKACKKDGAASALPVVFPGNSQPVRMCLPCRKDHFQLYPEAETDCTSTVNKRRRLGGQVGVEAEVKKDQAVREKLIIKAKEEMAVRCEELQHALEATNHHACYM